MDRRAFGLQQPQAELRSGHAAEPVRFVGRQACQVGPVGEEGLEGSRLEVGPKGSVQNLGLHAASSRDDAGATPAPVVQDQNTSIFFVGFRSPRRGTGVIPGLGSGALSGVSGPTEETPG